MNLSSFSMNDRNTGKQICHKFECLFERQFIVYVKMGCYLNDLFAYFSLFWYFVTDTMSVTADDLFDLTTCLVAVSIFVKFIRKTI